ncbi:hypothetical protein EYF80_055148 [Liparis tanakae]|uniref:Uncharacterized protein n=1 Tax=Liparis tanakae TaxID=230148 RepID=A0A4Z2F0F9_9TELE|nr:hypothetical protein EYF80_055148 [Liparis tanakae]
MMFYPSGSHCTLLIGRGGRGTCQVEYRPLVEVLLLQYRFPFSSKVLGYLANASRAKAESHREQMVNGCVTCSIGSIDSIGSIGSIDSIGSLDSDSNTGPGHAAVTVKFGFWQ